MFTYEAYKNKPNNMKTKAAALHVMAEDFQHFMRVCEKITKLETFWQKGGVD